MRRLNIKCIVRFTLVSIFIIPMSSFTCTKADKAEFDKLKSQAVLGNAASAAWLGTQYINPTNSCVDKNLDSASRWLWDADSKIESVPKKDIPEFHYILGIAFDELTDEQNTAIEHLDQALEKGYLNARIGLAKSYTKRKDWKNATRWWEEIAMKHAKKQRAEANYWLGLIRYAGLDGRTASKDESRRLLQKSLDGGEERARVVLAKLNKSKSGQPYVFSSFDSEDHGKLTKTHFVNCGNGSNSAVTLYYEDMKYKSLLNLFGSDTLEEAIKKECRIE